MMPQNICKKKIRIVQEEIIDINIHWCYFDGASQGDLTIGGAGDIVFSTNDSWVKFSTGLDRCTNNKDGLLSLKITMLLALTIDITHLQVFGDSLLIFCWMKHH